MELAAVEAVSDDDDVVGEGGLGDLLDDFVATATATADADAGEEEPADEQGAGAEVAAGSETEEEGYDSEELETGLSEGEELSGDEADDAVGELPGGRWPGRGTAPKAGSIASTYWREERHDRRGQLSTLDDQCVGQGGAAAVVGTARAWVRVCGGGGGDEESPRAGFPPPRTWRRAAVPGALVMSRGWLQRAARHQPIRPDTP